MGRVLVVSLALHAAVALALARLRLPPPPRSALVELTIADAPKRAPSLAAPAADVERPRPVAASPTARRHTAVTPMSRAPTAKAMTLAPTAKTMPGAPTAGAPTPLAARPSSTTPEPPSASPPASGAPAREAPTPRPNLFAPSALARAAELPIAPTAADRAWRPRHGVGGANGAGGTDIGSFLAEDAARQRVRQGAVTPALRTLERRLDASFAPTFAETDVSNRAALFVKQLRGFLRHPPKTGAIRRGIDPTQETLDEKMRAMRPDQAFFLGRRVEIFVRQKPDGTIVEMALRRGSGYRAFDDAALAAVERAVGGHTPADGGAHGGEVRTLWQLDATAYVVVSPNPELVFDEASGKHEWVYPLQKRVDHHVRLVAVY